MEKNGLVLQIRRQETEGDFFDNEHYKVVKRHLIFLGLYPYQKTRSRIICFTILMAAVTSVYIPLVRQLIKNIRNNDLDHIFMSIPPIITDTVCCIKVINLQVNRSEFKNIFDRIRNGWAKLTDEDELRILNEFSAKGSMYGRVYKNCMLVSLFLFTLVPLVPDTLDIIWPLNESRSRNLLFEVDYGVENDDYFYILFAHLAWYSIYAVATVYTVDSMYMLIVYHVCGLFALCGYRIKSLAERIELHGLDNGRISKEEIRQTIKHSINTHQETLEFTDFLEKSGRISYLMQVGLNMIGISVTGLQTIVKLNEIEESAKFASFFLGVNFHLLYNSIIGQQLINYSAKLMNDMYVWPRVVQTLLVMLHEMQRSLLLMQVRSKKPCKLTAGGLYDINLENYSMVVKTSMSYFMMFLQFRESSIELED